MKSVPVRLTLVVLLLGASAGAGYFIWTSEADRRAATDAASTFDAGAGQAARGLLELRAAQQAYVSAGQGEEFWIARVDSAILDLKASIGSVRAQATSPHAQTALDNSGALLQDFEQMDRRARVYARGGQRLIASDLIFSDGLELTGGAVAALDEARRAERQTLGAAAREIRRTQGLALGGYAAFALFVAALLVPVGAGKRQEPQPVVTPPSIVPARASEPLDLALALDGEAATWSPAGLPADTLRTPPEAVNLESIAAVCTELAQVVDTRSLPSILERTAAGINASGIVLWIADPDGRELSPIVSHGYSPQLLSRLGTIARDAQNATAAAFRTGLVQTVRADATSNGAIAAPLVSPGGTVGVMAAEVREEGEIQPARLAAAMIVAAQLATLVGPPVPRAQPKPDVALPIR